MANLQGVVTAALLACAAMAAPALANPDAKTQEQAHAHFKQGKAFLDAKVYDKAIEEFEVAYKLAPFPELLFNIAQAYRLGNQPEKAIASYEEFLKTSPDGTLADEARTHVAELTKEVNDKKAIDSQTQSKERADAAKHQQEAHDQAVFAQQKAAYDADQTRRARLAHARHVGTGLLIGGGIGIIGGVGIIIAAPEPGPIVIGAGAITVGFVLGLIGMVDVSSGADHLPPVAPPTPLASGTKTAASWTFRF